MPEIFLDSNVLLYSFAGDDARKQVIATAMVSSSLRTGNGIVSSQVIQECLSVITRKRLMNVDQARAWLKLVMPLCGVFPNEAHYQRTLDVHERYGFGFYDAAIVAAALTAGCRMLATENLQHNQMVEGLRIVNPFVHP